MDVWTVDVRTERNQPGERLADGLARKPFHLDVEELSEVAEPFDHLGGHAAVELDSREESGTRPGQGDHDRPDPRPGGGGFLLPSHQGSRS